MPQSKCDKQSFIQEQREKTRQIIKTVEEKGKRPVYKLDMLDARYIVREKRKGTTNKAIACALDVCITCTTHLE